MLHCAQVALHAFLDIISAHTCGNLPHSVQHGSSVLANSQGQILNVF